MNRYICACCRCRLSPTSTTGESGLYSPDRKFTLCEMCFLGEDAVIDLVGTNNIPNRIAMYEANLLLGPIA